MSLTDGSGLSASDVLALTANNNDGFGGHSGCRRRTLQRKQVYQHGYLEWLLRNRGSTECWYGPGNR